MIVIGADVHKSTHALAAVDADTGQLLSEREIAAREQGISKRCAGRAGSTTMLRGRSKIAAICRTISSKPLSLRGSECCGSHRN